MTTLYFTNPGEIDIRGATVAGLSAKDSDKPIGYFGTGLKYAIACVLRWGGKITIWSGTTQYEFTADNIEFRNREFKQVMMNAQPLGFTTEYGKNWEPWQVFRELYTNALDEGGTVYTDAYTVGDGITVIRVECDKLISPYQERDTIILPADLDYDTVQSAIRIKNAPSDYIYYRGVRVYKRPCVATYNIMDDLDLTEDRTVKYGWTLTTRIGRAVQASNDRSLIMRVLGAEPNSFDGQLDFDGYNPISDEFLDIAKRLYRENKHRHHRLQGIIEKHAPDLLNPEPIKNLSRMKGLMLAKAITLVAKMGVDPTKYPIHVAELGGSVLGRYSRETGEIFLSPECFNMGTKQVLSTLYEELIHAETGKEDCNYDMQTFLFNTIVSMYEEHVFQEPI